MEESYPYRIEVKLIEQIQPVARGDRYEDPLTKSLEERGLGIVTGGGAQLSPRPFRGERGIEFVCLDVELDNLDEALFYLKERMNELGAPVGSTVSYYTATEERKVEPIGELELLHIYLDAQNLREDVYANADLEMICKKLAEQMGSSGQLREPMSWSSETLLYFAGRNADEMFSRIETFCRETPLMQNARITFQRRIEEKPPIEFRLPFHNNQK